MGTTAARKARLVVENSLSVLALELMAAAQAIELRGGQPSPANQKLIKLIRRQVRFLEEDRELRLDVEAVNRMVRSDELLSCIREATPDFV